MSAVATTACVRIMQISGPQCRMNAAHHWYDRHAIAMQLLVFDKWCCSKWYLAPQWCAVCNDIWTRCIIQPVCAAFWFCKMHFLDVALKRLNFYNPLLEDMRSVKITVVGGSIDVCLTCALAPGHLRNVCYVLDKVEIVPWNVCRQQADSEISAFFARGVTAQILVVK